MRQGPRVWAALVSIFDLGKVSDGARNTKMKPSSEVQIFGT